MGDPEVVMHTPFDKYAEVTEYAADLSATDASSKTMLISRTGKDVVSGGRGPK